MVVDDNDEVRSVFSISLKMQGHEVIECTRGAEAIELFPKQRPEIVILDQSLPEIKGIEVGKQIRQLENGPNVVLALITGTDNAALRQLAEEAGFDDFLLKPISITELANWVDRVGLNQS